MPAQTTSRSGARSGRLEELLTFPWLLGRNPDNERVVDPVMASCVPV